LSLTVKRTPSGTLRALRTRSIGLDECVTCVLDEVREHALEKAPVTLEQRRLIVDIE
jgi:hypothetical protein